jgi:hypothetical protein
VVEPVPIDMKDDMMEEQEDGTNGCVGGPNPLLQEPSVQKDG